MKHRTKDIQKQYTYFQENQLKKVQKSPIKAFNYQLNTQISCPRKNRLLLSHKKQLSNHQTNPYRYERFDSNKLKQLTDKSFNVLNFSIFEPFLHKRPKTSKQKYLQPKQEVEISDKKQKYFKNYSHTMNFICKESKINPEINLQTDVKKIVPQVFSRKRFQKTNSAKTENNRIQKQCCTGSSQKAKFFSYSTETGSKSRRSEKKVKKNNVMDIQNQVVLRSQDKMRNRRPNTSHMRNISQEKRDKQLQFSYDFLEPW